MRRSASLIATAMSALLAGCGDLTYTSAPTTGNGSIGAATNVAVAVSPATSAIDVGQTLALSATVTGDSSNRGVTWTVVSGGGSVSPSTGMTTTFVAGAEGSTAVVKATSVLDATKSATATVVTSAAPTFTSPGQLSQAFVGVGYSASLLSTGGTGTRTYSVVGGTLPPGLVLNAATGVISGTPTAGGTTTFTARVTDSASPVQSGTANFTIGISALQLNSPALTQGVVGRAYTPATYTSAFSQGAVSFSVTAGALPAGLTLSPGGVLSGTPTVAGVSNFTVTAIDASGQRASGAQTITVLATLVFTSRTLPAGQTGTAYSTAVTAAGGTSPYTYAVALGSGLPAGVALSTSGALTGTPTTPGTYTFSITATDSGTGATAQSATASFSMTVAAGPLSITTSTLPAAVLGSPYSVTLQSQGGVAPYTYNVQSGALPTGVTLTTNGLLSGKPTASGTYSFTIAVSDAQSTPATATRAFAITESATLAPGPMNALLNGSYAFLMVGQSNGVLAPSAASGGGAFGADSIGRMIFDGAGSVTGTLEANSARTGYSGATSLTGSYAVGNDNRGQVVISVGGVATTLAIAVSNTSGGVATRFRMIEDDSTDPNDLTQAQASGVANLQTAADFTGTAVTGRYTFSLNGETPCVSCANTAGQYGAISAAGYFNLAGAGIITGGEQDSMTYSSPFSEIALSGSYSTPNATTGRGTITLTPVSTFIPAIPASPSNYVYYVISAKQIVMMSTDGHTGASLLAGMAYQQQQALFSAASLSGTLLSAENSVSGGNGTSVPPQVRTASLLVLNVTSNGVAMGSIDRNAAGNFVRGVPVSFTYTVSDEGRVVVNSGTATLPVFWLYDNNAGVGTELHTGAGAIGTATLDAEGSGFNAGSLNGLYALGTSQTVVPTTFVNGALTATGGASGTLTTDTTMNGSINNGTTSAVMTDVTGSGQVTLTAPNATYYGYMLNGSRFVFFNATPGFTQPVILFGEK